MLDRIINNVIARLVIYYLACNAFFIGLFMLFPQIAGWIAAERNRQAGSLGDGGSNMPISGDLIGPMELLDGATCVPVLLGLLSAFLLTLPVTWVYHWTRPRKRFNQAFAHTLLVVPTAIALVVFLVKGSLALAFSLAGIVAAVRFRTSLNEPMDAVYMFITIGIGLAAGVQLLVVAFFASVFFNIIALMVWRWDFGASPAVLHGWQLVDPPEAGQLLGVSGVVQPAAAIDEGGRVKPFNAQLRIHTTQVEAAQKAAVPILDENVKKWQLAQIIQNEDGTAFVEYDVRIKKSQDLEAFIEEIEASELKLAGKVEVTKKKAKKE